MAHVFEEGAANSLSKKAHRTLVTVLFRSHIPTAIRVLRGTGQLQLPVYLESSLLPLFQGVPMF